MSCPSTAQLRQMLESALSEKDAAWVPDHINDCSECQARLDAIVGGRPVADADTVAAETKPEDKNPLLKQLLDEMKGREPEYYIEERHKKDQPTTVVFPGSPSPAAPLGQLDRYLVLERIGTGAAGHVFKARDPRLNRLVAIKTLRRRLAQSKTHRARFEQEARAAAALEHDNIVTIHEVVVPKNFPPYLVMELVEGDSLHERIKPNHPFDARSAADIVRQVAVGLFAAHEKGVVHRDVKPSNILLADPNDRALIADFGLAREIDSDAGLTIEGEFAGTPAYMSPEQLSHFKSANHLSDIYSLGVILYELLTGDRPFRGVMRMVMMHVRHNEPPPPRELNDSIPLDLERICLKCLEKQPSKRYSNAMELATDLENWLDGKPVAARPLGPAERIWRHMGRNPSVFVPYAVAVFAMVVAMLSWTANDVSNRLATITANPDNTSLFDPVAIQTMLDGTERSDDDSPNVTTTKVSILRVIVKELADQNDYPELQLTALMQMGEHKFAQNKYAEARIYYQSSVDLRDAGPTDSKAWSIKIAECSWWLGSLQFRDSDFTPATDSLSRAVRLAQSILDSENHNGQAIQLLARSSELLGDIAKQDSELEQASDYWKRALQSVSLLTTKPHEEQSFDIPTKRQLAGLCLKLGRVNQSNQPATASEYFAQAHEYYLQIERETPDQLMARFDAANSYIRLTSISHRLGKSVVALENILRARLLLQELAERNPGNVDIQVSYARSQFWIGKLYVESERQSEAAIELKAAQATLESISSRQLDVNAINSVKDSLTTLKLDIADLLPSND